MAVSLNSVISFNPTKFLKESMDLIYTQANYQQVTRANIKILSSKLPSITSQSASVGLRHSTRRKRSRFSLVSAEGANVATETSDKDSEPIEGSNSNNRSSDNVPSVNSSTTDDKIQSNGAAEEPAPKSTSGVKRASLTARERLRAARVLSRYTETKPSKPELGSKLLEALQESDKKGKKRSGLPQAPTDMFDDSKRGMPKDGWTIEIPGGMDVFLIVFSFVFISSVMFATTYLVWKVGAIHFNEY